MEPLSYRHIWTLWSLLHCSGQPWCGDNQNVHLKMKRYKNPAYSQNIHGRILHVVEDGDLPFVTTSVHLEMSRKVKQDSHKIKVLYDLKYVNTKTHVSKENKRELIFWPKYEQPWSHTIWTLLPPKKNPSLKTVLWNSYSYKK